jgi:hypothetical protein
MRGMRKERKKLLYQKCKLFLSIHKDDVEVLDAISNCSCLLLEGLGSVGYDLYDLVVFVQIHGGDLRQDSISKFTGMMSDYAKKHSEYEHIMYIRKLLLKNSVINSSNLTFIAAINMLLNDFYSETNVSHVGNDGTVHHSSLISKYNVSIYDMLVFIACTNKMWNRYDTLLFSKSASEKVLKLYTDMFGTSYVKDIKIFFQGRDKEAMDHLTAKGVALHISNLFMTNKKDGNNLFQTLLWKREFVNGYGCNTAKVLHSLIENLPKDIGMHRKFYIRDSGITIRFPKPIDDITSISMVEVHDEKLDIHYIDIQAEVCGAQRSLYLCLEDISRSTFPFLFEVDYIVMLHVLFVLGCFEYLNKKLDLDDLDVCAKVDKETYFAWKDAMRGAMSMFDNFEFTFERPYWWNYSGHGVGTKHGSFGSNVIREKRKIGRYVRALPVGYHASDDAKSLANKYKIILEDGMTLVDDFEKEVCLKVK